MAKLVLTKETLKILSTASSISAFYNNERHRLIVYQNGKGYEHRVELTLDGWVRTPDDSNGHCFASLTYSGVDVFKLLKVGDEISLEWWPYNGSPFTKSLGLTVQALRLIIHRPKGKDLIRMAINLEDCIHNDSNMCVAMCKGFPKKEYEFA